MPSQEALQPRRSSSTMSTSAAAPVATGSPAANQHNPRHSTSSVASAESTRQQQQRQQPQPHQAAHHSPASNGNGGFIAGATPSSHPRSQPSTSPKEDRHPEKPRPHKPRQQHVVGGGHGRIGRNTSGKNLSRLNRASATALSQLNHDGGGGAGGAGGSPTSKQPHHRSSLSGTWTASQSSSPRPGLFKRNASAYAIPKHAPGHTSQTALRKNHSSGALAKGGSKTAMKQSAAAQARRAAKHGPAAPAAPAIAHHPTVRFDIGSDEDDPIGDPDADDGWTEDSASQSPMTTRDNTRRNSVVEEHGQAAHLLAPAGKSSPKAAREGLAEEEAPTSPSQSSSSRPTTSGSSGRHVRIQSPPTIGAIGTPYPDAGELEDTANAESTGSSYVNGSRKSSTASQLSSEQRQTSTSPPTPPVQQEQIHPQTYQSYPPSATSSRNHHHHHGIPDADAITSRLLQRRRAPPQMSSVSATVASDAHSPQSLSRGSTVVVEEAPSGASAGAAGTPGTTTGVSGTSASGSAGQELVSRFIVNGDDGSAVGSSGTPRESSFLPPRSRGGTDAQQRRRQQQQQQDREQAEQQLDKKKRNKSTPNMATATAAANADLDASGNDTAPSTKSHARTSSNPTPSATTPSTTIITPSSHAQHQPPAVANPALHPSRTQQKLWLQRASSSIEPARAIMPAPTPGGPGGTAPGAGQLGLAQHGQLQLQQHRGGGGVALQAGAPFAPGMAPHSHHMAGMGMGIGYGGLGPGGVGGPGSGGGGVVVGPAPAGMLAGPPGPGGSRDPRRIPRLLRQADQAAIEYRVVRRFRDPVAEAAGRVGEMRARRKGGAGAAEGPIEAGPPAARKRPASARKAGSTGHVSFAGGTTSAAGGSLAAAAAAAGPPRDGAAHPGIAPQQPPSAALPPAADRRRQKPPPPPSSSSSAGGAARAQRQHRHQRVSFELAPPPGAPSSVEDEDAQAAAGLGARIGGVGGGSGGVGLEGRRKGRGEAEEDEDEDEGGGLGLWRRARTESRESRSMRRDGDPLGPWTDHRLLRRNSAWAAPAVGVERAPRQSFVDLVGAHWCWRAAVPCSYARLSPFGLGVR
ncbi:hypothetical protein BDY21DRAFT_404703 [Lineolata rhizophorae]|uniref:Uncharacterized protein n=1 Tax=Lineolata rhizophorae TaxID=578093 RepID=A0A6A6NM18_9PEZI|nr:hypothetical protein BDY21DRAFT_404703 [Lineolata rhizophorae]